MKRFKCSVCGWIYDPGSGDPQSGIEPGIAFDDLPSGFVCPVCGASHDDFEEYD